MIQPSPCAQAALWRDGRAIALLMAATLTTMANATISPALPGLRRLFDGDPWAGVLTPMLVTAPSLSVVLCAPFVGLAADRFGRRALLLWGVVLFVLAGSAGIVLPSLAAIFASRLALGVAVAMAELSERSRFCSRRWRSPRPPQPRVNAPARPSCRDAVGTDARRGRDGCQPLPQPAPVPVKPAFSGVCQTLTPAREFGALAVIRTRAISPTRADSSFTWTACR
jgi:hypothetical protein